MPDVAGRPSGRRRTRATIMSLRRDRSSDCSRFLPTPSAYPEAVDLAFGPYVAYHRPDWRKLPGIFWSALSG